ncbi:MAG: hypothetical protein M1423_01720, partial [Acidobacteria bacterium]|nr:hypothetical protein [Acidobacteriota bacterium]
MAIHTVYTLSNDDPEARNWVAFFPRHGYTRLTRMTIERVFWLEGDVDVSRLQPLLINPLYQKGSGHSQL